MCALARDTLSHYPPSCRLRIRDKSNKIAVGRCLGHPRYLRSRRRHTRTCLLRKLTEVRHLRDDEPHPDWAIYLAALESPVFRFEDKNHTCTLNIRAAWPLLSHLRAILMAGRSSTSRFDRASVTLPCRSRKRLTRGPRKSIQHCVVTAGTRTRMIPQQNLVTAAAGVIQGGGTTVQRAKAREQKRQARTQHALRARQKNDAPCQGMLLRRFSFSLLEVTVTIVADLTSRDSTNA